MEINKDKLDLIIEIVWQTSQDSQYPLEMFKEVCSEEHKQMLETIDKMLLK